MHRSLRGPFPVALLLLAGLAPPPAGATTMIARSVEDLTLAATSVVRARTLATRSAWDERRRIVTTVRLRAEETLAGAIVPGAEFEVRHFGGVVDGIAMDVIGAPAFTAGEEVVLFLAPGPRGTLETVDLAQGKLEVVRDASGRERLTRRDLETVEWLRGPGPERIPDLATLRARVTAARRVTR